ncbi:hypothetical protein B0H13DRAFT_1876045 [Mycena leptocephala]|nr:hypothetical protein B0H13DRAFT_1876045 [Mycena leptocephala]
MESLALISHMESAPSFAAEALALNPRPNCQMGSCQMCRGHMLPLGQALNGTNVTNWARWMQKCQQCGWFYWHNDPTAIEHIPEGVQVRYAIKASSKEAGTPLLCPEQNCLMATNKQRRANRECDRIPPRCAPCCKQAGGCRAHRLNARDAPLGQTTSNTGFASSSANLLSSSSSDAGFVRPTSSSSQAASSLSLSLDSGSELRNFARPLNESYACGYLSRHLHVLEANSRLEATQKLQNLRENKPAKKFTLVNKVPGQFVVMDHHVLASAIVNGFIAYLECPLSRTWGIRDVRVPISTPPDSRVLLRTVEIPDEQCIGLDDEIARLMIDGSEESAREKTRRLLALSGSGHNQSQQQQARSYTPTLFQPAAAITSGHNQLQQARSATPTPSQPAAVTFGPERRICPLRFPLTWACDMAERFNSLRISRKGHSQAALQSAFETVFPECAFTSGTVYKHLKIYDDALKFEVLEKFVNFGQTPTEPPVIDDSDDGEDLQYDVMRARKEVYSYFEEGRLQSGSVKPDVPIEEMDVLGQYSPDGIELASVAVKSLLLSDADAVAMWGSREMAVWSEAALCALQEQGRCR